jgi:hypothetical protein
MERTIHFGDLSVFDSGCCIKTFSPLSLETKNCFSARKVAVQYADRFVIRFAKRYAVLALLAFLSMTAFSETCLTAGDMGDSRAAVTNTALRYFDMIAKGDAASLKQNAIPSLAADFGSIESAVKADQPLLVGVKATARPPFLLEAQGTAPIERAEFFCGVFGSKGQTADSAAFVLNNLPPGKYGIAILDAPSSKAGFTISMILQQSASDWKLGYLYIKSAQSGGHDSDWYAAHAREFQSKGQTHDAWLYFLEARNLVSPMPMMSTQATDKLYDESEKLQPSDFPSGGKTIDLPTGTATYKVTEIFPEVVGDDLDLIVKYQASDVSNTTATYSSNLAVMKALLAKYPELRGAFVGVVARAVESSGRDYGTMLTMKDIK